MRHGQIHVITNLFNTLCIHTVQLRQSEGTTRAVAELRAKLCLHGLQELQKTWEVTNWVLQLFFSYLDHSTAASLRVQPGDASVTGAIAQVLTESTPNLQLPGVVDTLPPRSRPLSTIPEAELSRNQADIQVQGAMPWSWTNEEANQFLFSQIENEFAFGEGEMLDWSPEEVAFNNQLFQPNDVDPNFMP